MTFTTTEETDKTGMPTPFRAWAITLLATLASTHALDAIATLCGLGVAMLPLVQGTSLGAALAVLLVSYLAWGLGLSVNLRANRMLLAATGTSTSALSKLLYDVAGRRLARRWRGLAANLGYVGMEIAKEAPCYIGAVGAALATNAMVFLGGANFGAALYEYGLARTVRRVLSPARGQLAGFASDWHPQT